jgi:hypothetical protein
MEMFEVLHVCTCMCMHCGIYLFLPRKFKIDFASRMESIIVLPRSSTNIHYDDDVLTKAPDTSGSGQLKCDGTRAETTFRLSAKRMSPFKSAGASVKSTTGSRGVRISGSNAGYTKFRGSVKSTGYLLHSPVSPSLPLPCVTVCHHISTGVY